MKLQVHNGEKREVLEAESFQYKEMFFASCVNLSLALSQDYTSDTSHSGKTLVKIWSLLFPVFIDNSKYTLREQTGLW